jgi:hypothetical protein
MASSPPASIAEGVMSIDSQRVADGAAEVISDPPVHSAEVRYDPELDRLFKEREAEIQRILAQRKPELIEQGIEAYKRDLPRLLAEHRYRQLVAYRGNELIAFGATYPQLRKRLTKKGCTDRGELFVTCVAPLEIDEPDDLER